MSLDPEFISRAICRGLRAISTKYGIGWVVPIQNGLTHDQLVRLDRAQGIIGIPPSKRYRGPGIPAPPTAYLPETLIGPRGDGSGGLLFHPSIYWEQGKPIQDRLRKARHLKALAAFRAAHGLGVHTVDDYGVNFIAGFEGFSSEPYDDGGGTWTIGYGHTAGVSPHTPAITRKQGLGMLKADLGGATADVLERVNRPLRVRQLDGLVSFVFNLGPGVLSDDQEIAKKVNRGQFAAAARSMLLYDHVNGERWPGLTRRREAEANMVRNG